MPSPVSFSNRSSLRRELRARRRALSPLEQKRAAKALARRLARLPELKTARRIALYWPLDGEIDPRPLQNQPTFSHRSFHLPVLQHVPADILRFARWWPGARLHRNRFRIPEPRRPARLSARVMDVVLLPLTGFDAQGNRLGMGGGFYDRTLTFKRRHRSARPLLVGVAHACQQVSALPAAAWDVPLAMIVTDRGVFRP